MAGLNSTALVHRLKEYMNEQSAFIRGLKPKLGISKTNTMYHWHTFEFLKCTTVVHNTGFWFTVGP